MSGKRNISYIKPAEPSFLAKFKRDVGYKEGPTVDTKKEDPSLDNLPERPDEEDDKPVVVVLKRGDLTQDEAEEAWKQMDRNEAEEHEENTAGDGRIVFKKPTKRNVNETSDLNVSSSKKKKEGKKTKSKSAKKVKNSSLLSFGEEEEDEMSRE